MIEVRYENTDDFISEIRQAGSLVDFQIVRLEISKVPGEEGFTTVLLEGGAIVAGGQLLAITETIGTGRRKGGLDVGGDTLEQLVEKAEKRRTEIKAGILDRGDNDDEVEWDFLPGRFVN